MYQKFLALLCMAAFYAIYFSKQLAQQPFHQQGPRGFIAPADLVGAHTLPALGELL